MLDKLRNFIFDIKDLVITIAIVSILFFAVTWKVNETLNIDFSRSGVVVIDPNETQPTQPSVDPGITEPTSADPTGSVPTGEPAGSEPTSGTSENPPTGGSQAQQPTTAPPAPTTAPPNTAPLALQTFVVREGELGYTIGENLKKAGFIADVNAFVTRAIELKLDSKLRSGTFALSKNDDVDTILRILTGGKR